MQNKLAQYRCLALIACVVFISGCANVQWREGSVLASDSDPQEQIQAQNQELVPSEPANDPEEIAPNRKLTPAPYPSGNGDPRLQAALQKIISQSKKRPENALAPLLRFADAYPESSGVQYHLGKTYFLMNQPDKAIDSLTKAIELAPKNMYAQNLLALTYRSEGEFAKARTHYKNAVRIWPDYATAWHNLGILEEIYLNNLEAALKAFENYLAIQTSKSQSQRPSKATQQVELWVKDLTLRLKNGR